MAGLGKLRRATWLAFVLALTAGCKPALPPKPAPALALTGRVIDRADLLDPATEQRVTARLARLEADTKVQFVVATTPSLNGKPIKEYSMALANSWDLGDAKRNDGLMLLVAPKERMVRIEVGKGLETTLPDALCAEIVKDMTPEFSKGRMSDGIEKGEQRLESELRKRLPGDKT